VILEQRNEDQFLFAESRRQGDQVGRIFACCAIVYFFEKYRNSPKIRATLSHRRSYVLILTKIGLGYVLGDFSTNSSGHPGRCSQNEPIVKHYNVNKECKKKTQIRNPNKARPRHLIGKARIDFFLTNF
jgi:hypothetical protein